MPDGIDSRAFQALQARVDALERQLRQQVLGNDPSTNFKQPLYQGGGQSGWFQLTNNGVNTTINAAIATIGGLPVQTSLVSQDVATTAYGIFGPFSTYFVDAVGNSVAGLSNAGTLGSLGLFNNSNLGGLRADGSPQIELANGGGGAHYNLNTILATGITLIKHLVLGSVALTLGGGLVIDDGLGDITTVSGAGFSTPGTLTLQAITAHRVLIGEGNSPVVGVSPGAAGLVLTSNGVGADPSFQPLPAGAVTSVFGRVGAVVATAGDYPFSYISGIVSSSQLPITGPGVGAYTVGAKLTGGGVPGIITIDDQGRITAIQSAT